MDYKFLDKHSFTAEIGEMKMNDVIIEVKFDRWDWSGDIDVCHSECGFSKVDSEDVCEGCVIKASRMTKIDDDHFPIQCPGPRCPGECRCRLVKIDEAAE